MKNNVWKNLAKKLHEIKTPQNKTQNSNWKKVEKEDEDVQYSSDLLYKNPVLVM